MCLHIFFSLQKQIFAFASLLCVDSAEKLFENPESYCSRDEKFARTIKVLISAPCSTLARRLKLPMFAVSPSWRRRLFGMNIGIGVLVLCLTVSE